MRSRARSRAVSVAVPLGYGHASSARASERVPRVSVLSDSFSLSILHALVAQAALNVLCYIKRKSYAAYVSYHHAINDYLPQENVLNVLLEFSMLNGHLYILVKCACIMHNLIRDKDQKNDPDYCNVLNGINNSGFCHISVGRRNNRYAAGLSDIRDK